MTGIDSSHLISEPFKDAYEALVERVAAPPLKDPQDKSRKQASSTDPHYTCWFVDYKYGTNILLALWSRLTFLRIVIRANSLSWMHEHNTCQLLLLKASTDNFQVLHSSLSSTEWQLVQLHLCLTAQMSYPPINLHTPHACPPRHLLLWSQLFYFWTYHEPVPLFKIMIHTLKQAKEGRFRKDENNYAAACLVFSPFVQVLATVEALSPRLCDFYVRWLFWN